jgi:hypothetical protein
MFLYLLTQQRGPESCQQGQIGLYLICLVEQTANMILFMLLAEECNKIEKFGGTSLQLQVSNVALAPSK